jgi:hypothetical protein
LAKEAFFGIMRRILEKNKYCMRLPFFPYQLFSISFYEKKRCFNFDEFNQQREIRELREGENEAQRKMENLWKEQKRHIDKMDSVSAVFFWTTPSESLQGKGAERTRAKEVFALIPEKYREGEYTEKKFIEAMKSALAECFFDGERFHMMESGVRDRYAEAERNLGQTKRVSRQLSPNDSRVASENPAYPNRTAPPQAMSSPSRSDGSLPLLPPTERAPRPPSVDPTPPRLFARNSSERIAPHSFELNQQFYNVETLKAQLSPKIREEANFVAEKFPPEWHGPLYRNALNAMKKGKRFDRNQVLILSNLSLRKAAIYLPTQGNVLFSDNFIGLGGVGNESKKNGTPLGSFRIEKGPSDNKFQYRIYVHGEELERKSFVIGDPSQAVNIDPSECGNSGSHGRTIRIHEWEGDPQTCNTKGCFGFPGDIAEKLYLEVGKRAGGRMESFVSA